MKSDRTDNPEHLGARLFGTILCLSGIIVENSFYAAGPIHFNPGNVLEPQPRQACDHTREKGRSQKRIVYG